MTTPEVAVDRVYSPADLDLRPATGEPGDDYRVKGDVRFSGRVRKLDGERFRLQGTVRAMLELDCSRCLEPFELPVVADVELSYVPQTAAVAQAPDVELGEDDLTTAYYHDHVLDLGEMIREQLTLALPMRPLCAEDCKGLCPQCGTNLNRGTCSCDVRWEDPRLAGLRSLLENKEHNA